MVSGELAGAVVPSGAEVDSVVDIDVAVGVKDVGSVLGEGHGAPRRRRPWSAVKRLRRKGELFSAARSRRAEATGIHFFGFSAVSTYFSRFN